MTMPAYISNFCPLVLVLVLLTVPAWAGFSWGAGCEGGNGTFAVNLTTVGEVVTIGFYSTWKVECADPPYSLIRR